MRISIVGAKGFIGSALTYRLQAMGISPITPGRADLSHGPPEGGWGTVVWAAGLTADFRERPHDTIAAHVSDLNMVLRNGGVTGILYLSSTRVYQRCTCALEEKPVACLPQDPSDLYNISKLMGESLCLSAGLSRVSIARLSNIVGPGEIERDTFLGQICRQARGGVIELHSQDSSAKDYLWIDDTVRVLAAMALSDGQGIMNVAGGRQIEHRQWVEVICRETGARAHVRPDAPRTVFPQIDNGLMCRLYGPPMVDPLERISEMLVPSGNGKTKNCRC
jgi:nucleoside-diphosphate-sugar epimerase